MSKLAHSHQPTMDEIERAHMRDEGFSEAEILEAVPQMHAPECAYHLDQYPWECSCRTAREQDGKSFSKNGQNISVCGERTLNSVESVTPSPTTTQA